MHEQYALFNELDDDLQRIEEEINKNLHSSVPLIALVSRYIIRSGGKRLRPLLMVLAARLLNYKAASLYDRNQPCGADANMAKVAAVEAGTDAVYHAMQAFGGYGYAVEYDVERWWREVNLIRLAPVTHQMALAFIGEHVLGLPKSY